MISPDDPDVNDALEKVSIEESQMSRREILVRDTINKELAAKKFHLRLAYLGLKEGLVFNYVEPIHDWVHELPQVDSFIVEKIKEYLEY